MRFLLFINRVAFICNICFLAMFALKDIKGLQQHQNLMGTLFVLGFSAIVINFITLLTTSIAYLIGKKRSVPIYLFILNIVCFFLEYYFYFMLHKLWKELIN